MSIRLMAYVFAFPRPSPTQQIVMLALADNANDAGECWPGLDELARKCALSRQGVIDQIDALEKGGALKVVREPGKVNRYRIPVNRIDPSTGLTRQPGGLVPVNGVDPHPSTGLTTPVNRVDPNRQEPSTEPPREPARAPVHTTGEYHAFWIEYDMAGGPSPEASFAKSLRSAIAAGVKQEEWIAWHKANPGRLAWHANEALIRRPEARKAETAVDRIRRQAGL